MRRAYRRPVTPQDMEWVLGFYQEGRREGTFQDGIELALRRILASPQFLVRAEREPGERRAGPALSDHRSGTGFAPVVLPLEQHPGRRADQCRQRRTNCIVPAVLEQQVRRMLADPKADALVENFGDQFLYLRNLPATSPDGVFYPDWDDELRKSFRRETELLFESIINEDRSVVDLLTADYTFLNERLAKHYGIPNIYGSQFRRVHAGAGAGISPRAAGPGQRPRAHLAAELPDLAGEARRVGARKHPGHAAAGAAAERSAARRQQGRQQRS